MKIQAKIQKWGNSLGLRITGSMKTIPHFEENMNVTVEISEKGLYVYRKPKKLTARDILPFTLAELLEGLNEYTAHTDEIKEFKYLPGELDV
ncbi:MAG: transcriptional regulator [Gammaproteobacteria bacterium]|nr:transcriptional regulator [Gammaproteobacteria bacterium]